MDGKMLTIARIHELNVILERGQLDRMKGTGSYALTEGRVASILREAGINQSEIDAYAQYRDSEE